MVARSAHSKGPGTLLTSYQDQALHNMNQVRPRGHVESGRTAAEIDAFEQAIQESKGMNQGSWIDLLRPRYLNRTIVSGPVLQVMHVADQHLQIVTLMFFFQQTTGQQFANSYGPT